MASGNLSSDGNQAANSNPHSAVDNFAASFVAPPSLQNGGAREVASSQHSMPPTSGGFGGSGSGQQPVPQGGFPQSRPPATFQQGGFQQGAPPCDFQQQGPSNGVPQPGPPTSFQHDGPTHGFQVGPPHECPQGGPSNSFGQSGPQIGFGQAAGWQQNAPQDAQDGQNGPPQCMCVQASMQRTVQKEGQNKGRVFFVCCQHLLGRAQCKYFQWADEPIRSAEEQQRQQPTPPPGLPPGPPCYCQQQSTPACVRKEGPNAGRWFFKCPKPIKDGCGFFAWTDEPPLPAGPPCGCGFPSKPLVVRKEGPNKGRAFSVCPANPSRCGFFEWGDEVGGDGSGPAVGRHGNSNYGPVATPARSGRGKGSGKGKSSGKAAPSFQSFPEACAQHPY